MNLRVEANALSLQQCLFDLHLQRGGLSAVTRGVVCFSTEPQSCEGGLMLPIDVYGLPERGVALKELAGLPDQLQLNVLKGSQLFSRI
jgi:hypothetical protein